jgi:hypothetical protein
MYFYEDFKEFPLLKLVKTLPIIYYFLYTSYCQMLFAYCPQPIANKELHFACHHCVLL